MDADPGVVVDHIDGNCKRKRKFYSRLWFEGRNHSLGYFVEEVEAARAYDRKAVELFGEFARLNFPEEWPAERRAEVAVKTEDGSAQAEVGKQKKEAGRVV